MKLSLVEWVSIGSIIISVIAFIVGTFFTKSKGKKTVEKTNKIITLVSEIIPQAIIFAEKNGSNGENKKLLALSKILIDCVSNKIDYEKESDNINLAVEDLISFSKEVNAVKVSKEV